MKLGWILLLVAVLAFGADKKHRGPDVEIVEALARRGAGTVTIDGKVKNVGEKPLNGLVLLFHFGATDHQTLVTKKDNVEDSTLAPQQETEFHVEVPEPARAVEVRLEAEDRTEKALRTGKGGPYPIE